MSAKKIIIKPITGKDANIIIKKLHYSGKVVPNSQLHFGVFYDGKCGGALQFGPSMMKKSMQNLVQDTKWHDFIELNRMAFAEWLPRNSESRAIAFCLRYIKKNYPNIKWVVSFADATQCGDGAIYRASGFYLTDIRENAALRVNPANGEVMHTIQAYHLMIGKEFKTWQTLKGFQLRYIYFIDKSYKEKLTVPIIDFKEIDKAGAKMYRGERLDGVSNTPTPLVGTGGASPTSGLQTNNG
jgi:hypothetical protein